MHDILFLQNDPKKTSKQSDALRDVITGGQTFLCVLELIDCGGVVIPHPVGQLSW